MNLNFTFVVSRKRDYTMNPYNIKTNDEHERMWNYFKNL